MTTKIALAAVLASLALPAVASASYLYADEAGFRVDQTARLNEHRGNWDGYNVGRCHHLDRHRVDCDLVTYRPGEQTFWVAHVRRTDLHPGIRTAVSLTYVKTIERRGGGNG
jgi:hypothetical protein